MPEPTMVTCCCHCFCRRSHATAQPAAGSTQHSRIPVTLRQCQPDACSKHNQGHHADPSIMGCTLENLRSRIFLTRSQAFVEWLRGPGKGVKITDITRTCWTLCRTPGIVEHLESVPTATRTATCGIGRQAPGGPTL